jgi:RNA polymerase sigma factor (sigma-70 family)
MLENVGNVESYLYISLRNRINDEFRRNVRLCDNEINDASMRPVAEAQQDHKEYMERQMALTANMEKFFDKLSPRQRQIINLYYMEHLKYEDICQIMGINYQSVRNLMHRSIRRLRECAIQMQPIL